MQTVLDHGYVKLIETWGTDESIISAARMSTDKGFLGWGPVCENCGECEGLPGSSYCSWQPMAGKREDHSFVKPGDEKLLRYLWENKHHTPFEMGGLTVEVQAPIFVFREWHRHRVPFSYNEMSARYAPLPDVNYIPSVERLMANSHGGNKQAGTIKGAEALTEYDAEFFRASLAESYATGEILYQEALRRGVPKELARVHLPVGRYSKMRASANVRGWLNFLTLRSDMNPGAQWEIRQFANAVGDLIALSFPRTWSLFSEKK